MSEQSSRDSSGRVPQEQLPTFTPPAFQSRSRRPSLNSRSRAQTRGSKHGRPEKTDCQDLRRDRNAQDQLMGWMRHTLMNRWPQVEGDQARLSGINCLTVLMRAMLAHSPVEKMTLEATASAEQKCALLSHAFLTFGPPNSEDHDAAMRKLTQAMWSRDNLSDVPPSIDLRFNKLCLRHEVIEHVWKLFDMNQYQDILRLSPAELHLVSTKDFARLEDEHSLQLKASGWPSSQEFTVTAGEDFTKLVNYLLYDCKGAGLTQMLFPVPNLAGNLFHCTIIVGDQAPSYEEIRECDIFLRQFNKGGDEGEMEWDPRNPGVRYTLVAIVKCASDEDPLDCIRLYTLAGEPIEPMGYSHLGPYYDNTWRCEELSTGTRLFCLYAKNRFEVLPGASELVDEAVKAEIAADRKNIMSILEGES